VSEAIEMACNRALQRVQLLGGACLQPAFETVAMRLQGQRGVSGPVGAARIAREHDGARIRRERDGEVVAPVLAELLQIAAALFLDMGTRILDMGTRKYILRYVKRYS
jgi:hypothetical protein